VVTIEFADKNSNIKAVTYDYKSQRLSVTYKQNDTYLYVGVPQTTFDDLKSAESVDAFIAHDIRQNYKQVTVRSLK
jgi:hypothetical protein